MSMITDPRLEIVLTAKDMTAGAFKKVESYTQSLTRHIFSLNGAIGVVAGATGMGYFIQRNLAAADAVGKTADKLGLSTKALQEYRYMAERSGVATNTLDMGMQRFTRRMAEAAQGSGELKGVLEQYGIAVRDSNGRMRESQDVFNDLADAINGAESDSERLRIAFKAFDSEGAAMVNMLRKGSQGLDDLRARYDRLGIAIEDDLIRQSEKAKDSLDDLTKVISTSTTRAVVALAPEIGTMAENMATWVAANKTFLTQDIPGHVRGVGDAIVDLKDIYDSIPDYITGPAGMGIVGTAILGRTPGRVIATIAMINELAGMTGNSLQDLVRKHNESGQAIINLWDSIAEAMGWTKEEAEQAFHAIGEGTAGFDRYSKATDKAGKATGDLTGNIKPLTAEAKKAAESLKDLQVQSALDNWGFADLDEQTSALLQNLDWVKEAQVQNILDTEQARAESWQREIDAMNDMVAEEKRVYEDLQKDKARAEEKARQEHERKWKRVYDDMHGFAADTFYDFFKGTEGGWKGLLDTMEDMFIRSLANMATHAAMTNIFGPIMNGMAGSAFGNLFGLPSTGAGFNFGGLSNIGRLFGLGGWNTGVSATGGIGAAGGAYQGPGMGAAMSGSGMPFGMSTGMTNMIGMGAFGGMMSFVMPKILGAMLGDKPRATFQSDSSPEARSWTAMRGSIDTDPYEVTEMTKLGEKSKNFDYWLRWRDVDDPATQRQVYDYFDNTFAAYQNLFGVAINDVLKEGAFQVDTGRMDKGGTIKDLFSGVFENMLGSLMESVLPDITSGAFDTSFFKAIASEGNAEFEAFGEFAQVVQNTEGFMEDFNRRIEDLGQTSVDAYHQIQAITLVLGEMGATVDAITNGTVIANIKALSDAWSAQISVLEQAHATVEQLTKAEQDKNLVIGSQITGLTHASIAQAIKSGSGVDAVVSSAVANLIAERMAEDLFEDLTPLMVEVGETFDGTAESIDGVISLLKDAGYQIEDTFGELTKQLDETRTALDGAIQKERSLAMTRLGAADQINNLLHSLQGGSLAPVQSLEFFERRYEQLLGEAQSATTAEQIERAISNLTGLVPDYLDFAQAYGGSGYKDLFEKITSDLKEIEIDQRSEAERQLAQLEDINHILGVTSVSVLSIEQALRQYLGARAEAGQGPTSLAGMWEEVRIVHPEIGEAVDNLFDHDFFKLLNLGGGLLGFAGGGTVMGPASGYTVPVTFHGKEHIVNDTNMEQIKRLVAQGNSGPIQLNVSIHMGTRQFNDFTVDVLKTDSVAQEEVQRIARAV